MAGDAARKEEKRAERRSEKKAAKVTRGAREPRGHGQHLMLFGGIALGILVWREMKKKSARKPTEAPVAEWDCRTADGYFGEMCRAGATIPGRLESFENTDAQPGLVDAQPQFGTLQGIAAMRDVAAGERVMEIPKHLMLYAENVQQEVKTACEDCEDHILLILGLAYESQHPRPQFKTYIDSLPKYISSLPFFQPEHIALTKQRQPKAVELMTDRLDDAMNVATSLGLTEAQLRWSYAMIQSRVMLVQIGETTKKMLMPAFDTLNHASQDDFQVLAPECNETVCWNTAHKPVKRGQQMLGFYGSHANVDLLIGWGFTMRNNPYGPGISFLNVSLIKSNQYWLDDVGCSEQVALRPPSLTKTKLQKLPGVSTDDMPLLCHFLASAFDSVDSTKEGLGRGALSCLEPGHGHKCLNKAWRKAGWFTHKAAQRSCKIAAKKWQSAEVAEAMKELAGMDDEISFQYLKAIGDEVQMLGGCIAHHGEVADQLMAATKDKVDNLVKENQKQKEAEL